jgi:hypothetical protein
MFPFSVMALVEAIKEDGLMEYSSGPGSMYRTAIHEVSHGLSVLAHGGIVESIDVINPRKGRTYFVLPVLPTGQKAMVELFVYCVGTAAESEILGKVTGVVALNDELQAGHAALLLRKATGWPGDGQGWTAMLTAIAKRWAREHESSITYAAGQLVRDGGKWGQSRAMEVLQAAGKMYGSRALFLGPGVEWQFRWHAEMTALLDEMQAVHAKRGGT